jgi:hypothetical protein
VGGTGVLLAAANYARYKILNERSSGIIDEDVKEEEWVPDFIEEERDKAIWDQNREEDRKFVLKHQLRRQDEEEEKRYQRSLRQSNIVLGDREDPVEFQYY